VLRERGRIVGRKGIEPSNPKVKQAKIFTLPVSAEKYDQLIKEFQQHFKTH